MTTFTKQAAGKPVTALLGTKLGMTQVWDEAGRLVPVTVVQVGTNVVTQLRTEETDGYRAVQLAFGEIDPRKVTQPLKGHFEKAGTTPRRFVAEIRTSEADEYTVGQELSPELFSAGEVVDVTGTSKGKGFQGVMKRHGMRGKPGSHGVHEYFRHGGSIGCRLTPGRVLPGKRMGGQMGRDTQTLQNVKVVRVMADEGVVLVKGPVPGATGSYVTIRLAQKPAVRALHRAAKGKKSS